jgi:hypothetical protein
MDIKLALRVARDNWNNVRWWQKTAVPFAKRTILSGTLKPYYRFFGPDGDDFISEDWDNLLLLDACRYDMFKDTCEIDGELKSKTSVGSSTPDFLKQTFRGGDFQDIVYVTANPQVNLRLDPEIFHDVVEVWKTDWNNDLGTVEPHKVTKRALEALERHPNKRLIVHYMQPHYPFIGQQSEELDGHSGFELSKRLASDEEADRDERTVWDQLKDGEVSEGAVWEAYVENLELVLDDIGSSIDGFEGKTVITSDHGNLMGETATPFRLELYGHPTGIHAEDLVTVPWLSIGSGPRREIHEGERTEEHPQHDIENEQEIQERLKDLGYA